MMEKILQGFLYLGAMNPTLLLNQIVEFVINACFLVEIVNDLIISWQRNLQLPLINFLEFCLKKRRDILNKEDRLFVPSTTGNRRTTIEGSLVNSI